MNPSRPFRLRRLVAAAVLVAGFAALAAAQTTVGSGRDRAALVQRNVTVVAAETGQSKQRLAALQQKLDELNRKLNELPPPVVQPPEPEKPKTIELRTPGGGPSVDPPEKEKKDPEEVPYRLNEARKSGLSSGAGFVCLDSRVLVFDTEALNKAEAGIPERDVKEAVHQSLAKRDWVTITGGPVPVDGGDFDLKVDVKMISNSLYDLKEILVPKPVSTGETVEQAKAPGSAFLALLGKFDPAKHNVQFVVYPTGHDTFRALRKEVWDRNYTDVGWNPIAAGKLISIGAGRATVQ